MVESSVSWWELRKLANNVSVFSLSIAKFANSYNLRLERVVFDEVDQLIHLAEGQAGDHDCSSVVDGDADGSGAG